MEVREATSADFDTVWDVEQQAFGSDKEAKLVQALCADPSAEPLLSLLAYENRRGIGHVLFTRARLIEANEDTRIALLAPLAVVPDEQRKGIGQALVKEGLRRLTAQGVELVFVLGHPGYYPRCGFEPAGRLGFDAPYPIPEKDAGAWMVQALVPGVIGSVQGRVMCADALDRPEYWRE